MPTVRPCLAAALLCVGVASCEDAQVDTCGRGRLIAVEGAEFCVMRGVALACARSYAARVELPGVVVCATRAPGPEGLPAAVCAEAGQPDGCGGVQEPDASEPPPHDSGADSARARDAGGSAPDAALLDAASLDSATPRDASEPATDAASPDAAPSDAALRDAGAPADSGPDAPPPPPPPDAGPPEPDASVAGCTGVEGWMCDPICDTGCAAGRSCKLTHFGPACYLTPAVIPLGDACVSSSSDGCASRLGCSAFDGSATCRAFCNRDSHCEVFGPRARCSVDRATTVGHCFDSCDPLEDTGCEASESCRLTVVGEEVVFACSAIGDAPEGSPCGREEPPGSPAPKCQAGLVCDRQWSGMGICRVPCQLTVRECPSGEACRLVAPIDEGGWGACVPP